MAAAVIASSSGVPAMADLNKFEAETRGEFGIGSAAQYGSADLRYHIEFLSSDFIENFQFAEMNIFCFAAKQFTPMKISGKNLTSKFRSLGSKVLSLLNYKYMKS